MPCAIVVTSGKGGTGKTSTTSAVASCLAALGSRVLCIDMDIGLRNLDLSLGMSDRALMDFTDVLEGRCTLERGAVEHPTIHGLFLLTAPMNPRPVSLEAMQDLIADAKAPPVWAAGSVWPPAAPTGPSWSPPPTPLPCGMPSAR